MVGSPTSLPEATTNSSFRIITMAKSKGVEYLALMVL